jgi:hypothetical protein
VLLLSGLGREVGSDGWLFVCGALPARVSVREVLSLVSVFVLTAVAYGLTAHTEERVCQMSGRVWLLLFWCRAGLSV